MREVREQRTSMEDGSCLFGRGGLPFMRLVRNCSEKTPPFMRLFYWINATHRSGLDLEAD